MGLGWYFWLLPDLSSSAAEGSPDPPAVTQDKHPAGRLELGGCSPSRCSALLPAPNAEQVTLVLWGGQGKFLSYTMPQGNWT